MFLYNFVVAHWIVSLVVYLLVFSFTALRFAVIVKRRVWWSKIYWFGFGGGKPTFYGRERRFHPLRFPLKIATLLFSYLIAIPLFLIFRLQDFADWKEKREWQKIQAEATRQARERRRHTEETNRTRTLQRRGWFSDNKPTLYFNTLSGVTAVLRPADYQRAKRDTQNARTNELWTHKVLKPDRGTFTFVTKTGRDLIQTNSEHAHLYMVAGWLSDLHEICQAADCELVRDETIFVPWVNETLVSFREQAQILKDCHGQASQAELIDKQAPDELQPLPVY